VQGLQRQSPVLHEEAHAAWLFSVFVIVFSFMFALWRISF